MSKALEYAKQIENVTEKAMFCDPEFMPFVSEELRRLVAVNAELLEALKEITEDYSDRFDLDSPSTNPGIKSSIAHARAAIASAQKQMEQK